MSFLKIIPYLVLIAAGAVHAQEFGAPSSDDPRRLADLPPTAPVMAPPKAAPNPVLAPIVRDVQAKCGNLQFVGWSTKPPSTTHIPELLKWDDKLKAYTVQGPALRKRLNLPNGPDNAPYVIPVARGKQNMNADPDWSRYQQTAWCDAATGAFYFQQVYNDNLQPVFKRVRIQRADFGDTYGFSINDYDERFQRYLDGPQVVVDQDVRSSGA